MCWWEAGQRMLCHLGAYLSLVGSQTPPKKGSSMEEMGSPKHPSSPGAEVGHIRWLSSTGGVCSLCRDTVNRITVLHYRQK